MNKKYVFPIFLICLFVGLFVGGCQSNSEKKDDHVTHHHEGHNHKEHHHEGHNHKGHSHEGKEQDTTPECKNCGMPVDDANWRVKYMPSPKEETFFCSPKCYFKASNTQKEYSKVEFVYFSVFGQKSKTIEAKKAYFIRGTNEKSPMGIADFLVTDTLEEAKKLQEEKKGKEILTFEKITSEMTK